jgi:putative spermidine/putrescine transport system ATP-binding protein
MIIAGFVTADAGSVMLDGRRLDAMPPERRNLGVVFQSYALFPHMTAFENTAYPLRTRRVGRREVKARVDRALEMVQLGAHSDRLPSQLSGGQQQRVALARALVFEPPVLLMDEPLGALDKSLRTSLQLEIKRLQRSLGITVVYVTHDQDEALSMSDRIAVMRDGSFEQYAGPREIYERPRTRFVAGFVGDANLLEGRIAAHAAHRTAVAVGSEQVMCSGIAGNVGDPVTLVIRPEWFRLDAVVRNDARAIRGVVDEVVYSGEMVRYWITTPALRDGRLLVKEAPDTGSALRAVGDSIVATFDPDNVWPLPDANAAGEINDKEP